jgi:hypothetical protein
VRERGGEVEIDGPARVMACEIFPRRKFLSRISRLCIMFEIQGGDGDRDQSDEKKCDRRAYSGRGESTLSSKKERASSSSSSE